MVPVSLPGASYDIVIGNGVLADFPDLLIQHCPARHYAIISDTHVAPLYAERLQSILGTKNRITTAVFPAGEWNKTRETWSALTDQLLAAGVARDGAILAVGGGVVGDVAGFVAATYLRGVPYVQVPTTLLAMIDSSVGGKTGVDTTAGKNLIGAFHQPRLVVADVQTLATLPRAHLASGLAEALKHGAIADRSYFEQLAADREKLLARDLAALEAAVVTSVRIKSEVVASDEREQGRRSILNFGHTVGHAAEAATGYALLHGEAVALGMRAEAEIGARAGVTNQSEAETLFATIEKFGLPSLLPHNATLDRLLDAMRQDKKSRAGEIRFALIERIGRIARGPNQEWTIPISESLIKEVLERKH